MSFGTSYSISVVDPIDWVHTSLTKRLIRGVAGTLISVGFYNLVLLIKVIDQTTIFLIHRAFTAFTCSFFIYGLYPIICQKIGLVDSCKDDSNNPPREELLTT